MSKAEVKEEKLRLPKYGRKLEGVPGEMTVSSYYNEELRVDDLKLSDYRRMKDNDGQVQMLLSAVVNTILASGFDILDDPEYTATHKNSNESQDSEEKQFIEQNLLSPRWKGGMSTDINIANRINMRALEEGFRIYEVIYRLDSDGKIRLDKLAPRASKRHDSELKIITDDQGNFAGFRQMAYFKDKYVDVQVLNDTDIAKVINVVYGEEYGSNYGRPALKPIHYHYDKLHKALYITHVGLELGSVKLRSVRVLGGTSDAAEELFSHLERTGLEKVLMYDGNNYELKFEDVSDAQVLNFGKDIINYHTSQMAKALLAQFIDIGSQISTTGARSVGLSQQDFFKNSLHFVANILIEKPWNKVISDLIRMNFDRGIYPTLKVRPISDDSIETIHQAFLEMVRAGKVTKSVERELIEKAGHELGLDINTEEIEAELDERKAIGEEIRNNLANPDLQRAEEDKKPIDNAENENRPLRPLFFDEQKVKLVDIQRRLDQANMEVEVVLRNKLEMQKNKILDQYVEAARQGIKAINKVQVKLAEESDLVFRSQQSSYSEELLALAIALFEYGKIGASNELNKSVPATTRSERAAVENEVNLVIEKQIADLKFRLTNVINNALSFTLPENDARRLLDEEYESFFNTVLTPTINALGPKVLNKGRQLAFSKHPEVIFAFRYTAVLDNRTTDYCRELDGRVFQATDPEYVMVTPPNHYGCRSVWTPILITETDGVRVNGKPADLPIYSSINTFRDTELSEPVEEDIEEDISKMLDML